MKRMMVIPERNILFLCRGGNIEGFSGLELLSLYMTTETGMKSNFPIPVTIGYNCYKDKCLI